MASAEFNNGFNEGILNALALMSAHGNADSTEFRELVSLSNEAMLIAYARKQSLMRWSGLDKYLRNKREEARMFSP